MSARITRLLAEHLGSPEVADSVELIVELSPADTNEPKKRFAEQSERVRKLVERMGGKVTGQAWLNQTLRIQIPAHAVRELGDIDGVEALDMPRSLRADTPPS